MKQRSISSRLRAYRTARGLSQSGAAAALGVSLRTLQEWEQGRRTPCGLARTHLDQLLQNPAAK
jgi:putative transcriptional regulator